MRAHESLPIAGEPEVGWRLVREAWGQGYATEAARAVFADGFQRLGFDHVLAFTGPDNLRSQGVMRRLGLVREPHRDFDYPDLPPGDPNTRSIAFVAYP